MKPMRLPSGLVINLDLIETLNPCTVGVSRGVELGFTSSTEVIQLVGDDAVMLKAWMEKRPLLMPPARGKGKTS